jgi:hypothetical protein
VGAGVTGVEPGWFEVPPTFPVGEVVVSMRPVSAFANTPERDIGYGRGIGHGTGWTTDSGAACLAGGTGR